MIKYTAFDIETGPLPDDEISRIAPPFDPNSIKVGNLGLEKAAEKLNAAKVNHLGSIRRRAALHAEYGRVLAIGWATEDKTTLLFSESDEKTLLNKFWQAIDESYHAKGKWVGFNIYLFDLPFLIRRSIIHGILIPPGLLPKNNRYWPDFFIDLMQSWQTGDYREMISLDRFAKALGHDGKNGDGKHFSKLLKEDEEAAMAYLENDLKLTRNVADAVFRSISI
jgi:DNA polymerase elongation subunit (family B)